MTTADATTQVEDKGRAELEAKAQKLEHHKLVYVDRRTIQINDYNPNSQTPEEYQKLLNSMREFGFTQPILVNRTTGEIVDGEHRWRASGEVFGKDCEIPVIYVDWDRSRRQIATLSHNRARGTEDVDKVSAMLQELQAAGFLELAQEVLVIDQAEIDAMLGALPAIEAQLPPPDYTAAAPVRSPSPAPAPPSPPAQPVAEAAIDTTAPRADRAREAEGEAPDPVYRLTLTFTGEEGQIVRRVLGDEPAAKVLELCMLAEGGTL